MAVSIGEPPPKPIRQSKSPRLSSATPASITVSVGSGTVSLNTVDGDAGGGQRVEAMLHMAGCDHERIGDHQRARQAELAEHLGDLAHRAAGDLQHAGRGDVGVHCCHGASSPERASFTTKSREPEVAARMHLPLCCHCEKRSDEANSFVSAGP